MIVKYVICSLHLFNTNSVCGVSFSMFYRLHEKRRYRDGRHGEFQEPAEIRVIGVNW